jgi:hypothetical protein
MLSRCMLYEIVGVNYNGLWYCLWKCKFCWGGCYIQFADLLGWFRNVIYIEEESYITCLKSNQLDPITSDVQMCYVIWENINHGEEQSYSICFKSNPPLTLLHWICRPVMLFDEVCVLMKRIATSLTWNQVHHPLYTEYSDLEYVVGNCISRWRAQLYHMLEMEYVWPYCTDCAGMLCCIVIIIIISINIDKHRLCLKCTGISLTWNWNNNNNNSIKLFIIYVLSQQLQGQLQTAQCRYM